MKLPDLLRAGAVVPALCARTVPAAVDELTGLLVKRGLLPAHAFVPDFEESDDPSRLQLHSIEGGTLLVSARVPRSGNLLVALGRAGRDEDVDAPFQRIVLLLTEHPLATLTVQVIPALTKLFEKSSAVDAVTSAESETEMIEIDAFQGVELHEYPLVSDAMTPMTYRVYPDTPIEEAVSLMNRRNLRALAVVGEQHELIGIVTSGDLLGYLLPAVRSSDSESDLSMSDATVRDAMSRAVMCVSGDQSLMEAAHIMVNKRIHQLPVTKEGQVVGFLTRDRILNTLFGSEESEPETPKSH